MQVLENGRLFEISTGYTKCLGAEEAFPHNITYMKLECVQNDGNLSICVVMVFKVPENFFMVTLYVLFTSL